MNPDKPSQSYLLAGASALIKPSDVFQINPHFESFAHTIRLRTIEWRVLFAVDGYRTVREICNQLFLDEPQSREIFGKLQLLNLIGEEEISLGDFLQRSPTAATGDLPAAIALAAPSLRPQLAGRTTPTPAESAASILVMTSAPEAPKDPEVARPAAEAAPAALVAAEPEPVKAPEPEPVKAVEPEPVKAPEPEPVKAVEPEPVNAPEPEPVKAVEPEPVKAPEPEPVKAVEPEPVKAPEPEPVKAVEPSEHDLETSATVVLAEPVSVAAEPPVAAVAPVVEPVAVAPAPAPVVEAPVHVVTILQEPESAPVTFIRESPLPPSVAPMPLVAEAAAPVAATPAVSAPEPAPAAPEPPPAPVPAPEPASPAPVFTAPTPATAAAPAVSTFASLFAPPVRATAPVPVAPTPATPPPIPPAAPPAPVSTETSTTPISPAPIVRAVFGGAGSAEPTPGPKPATQPVHIAPIPTVPLASILERRPESDPLKPSPMSTFVTGARLTGEAGTEKRPEPTAPVPIPPIPSTISRALPPPIPILPVTPVALPPVLPPLPVAPAPTAPVPVAPPAPLKPFAPTPAPAPAAAEPVAPAAPAGPPKQFRLGAVIEYILKESGGGTLGQLATYRILLQVPPELLREAGIRSLEFDGSSDIEIKNVELQRALTSAIEKVLEKKVPEGQFMR